MRYLSQHQMEISGKNILFISYDGLTDPLGQSQVLPYLSGLRKKGHRISIVSVEKESRKSLVPQLQARLDAEGIAWKKIAYTKKPPIISTVKDLLKLRSLCEGQCKNEKFDIVHCRSYLPALIGLHLKRKFGIAFLFDMRGFYADERVDGMIWDQDKFIYRTIYRYFKKKEKEFLSEADQVISLTEAAKKEIHAWNGIAGQPVPVKIIPCCADLSLFRPGINHQQIAKDLRLEKFSLVISYAGSLGTWYLLKEMLEFFRQLLITYPEACLLFITPDNPEEIKAEAKKTGLDPERSIRIVNALYKDVPAYLSCSQVSIFFIKPAYSKTASSPTKQAEILGTGLPVICNAGIGDTDSIILDSGAGAVVRSFTNEEYDKVIKQLPELLKIPSEKIREYAVSRLSLEIAVERYNEVYQRIGNHK